MTQGDLFSTKPAPREPNPGTQKAKVLAALRSGGTLGVSNVVLNDTCCFRYSARIHELRSPKHGFNITKGPALANGLRIYWINE